MDKWDAKCREWNWGMTANERARRFSNPIFVFVRRLETTKRNVVLNFIRNIRQEIKKVLKQGTALVQDSGQSLCILFIDARFTPLAVFPQQLGNLQGLLLLVWTLRIRYRLHVVSLCIQPTKESSYICPLLFVDITWAGSKTLFDSLDH